MSLLDPRFGALPVFFLLCILGYVLLSWFGAADISTATKAPPPKKPKAENEAREEFEPPLSKIS